jgi:hypothetical protein
MATSFESAQVTFLGDFRSESDALEADNTPVHGQIYQRPDGALVKSGIRVASESSLGLSHRAGIFSGQKGYVL